MFFLHISKLKEGTTKNKFQIIYDDGRAVNIWHPDFIKFFSFLDIQEMFNIAQVVKHKRRGK